MQETHKHNLLNANTNNTEQDILNCTNLSQCYIPKQFVLKDINFSLQRGEIKALVGANGSGKTTLIKVLAGNHIWQEGTITLNTNLNKKIFKSNRQYESSQDLRDNITTVMSGESGLENNLNTYDFLKYWFLLSDEIFTAKHYSKMMSFMRDMRMNPQVFLNRRVSTYSRGMKQKVHILKSFLSEKPIVFMDEPFIGLDPFSVNSVIQVIKREKAENRSFIIISHELAHLCSVADEVAFISNGTLGTAFRAQSLLNDYSAFEVTYTFPKQDIDIANIGFYLSQIIQFKIQNDTQKNMFHISSKQIQDNAFCIYVVARNEHISEIEKNLSTDLEIVFESLNHFIVKSGFRSGMTYDILSEIALHSIS